MRFELDMALERVADALTDLLKGEAKVFVEPRNPNAYLGLGRGFNVGVKKVER